MKPGVRCIRWALALASTHKLLLPSGAAAPMPRSGDLRIACPWVDNEKQFSQIIGTSWAWRIGVRHSLGLGGNKERRSPNRLSMGGQWGAILPDHWQLMGMADRSPPLLGACRKQGVAISESPVHEWTMRSVSLSSIGTSWAWRIGVRHSLGTGVNKERRSPNRLPRGGQ